MSLPGLNELPPRTPLEGASLFNFAAVGLRRGTGRTTALLTLREAAQVLLHSGKPSRRHLCRVLRRIVCQAPKQCPTLILAHRLCARRIRQVSHSLPLNERSIAS